MAQRTYDPLILRQIDAGIKGRRKGHSYENELAGRINALPMPYYKSSSRHRVVQSGRPEIILLDKILEYYGWDYIDKVEAYATGKLATSEEGKKELLIDGKQVSSSKSDVILVIYKAEEKKIAGVSVKQCNNKKATNAQVFFTTATAFYNMVRSRGIPLSDKALRAMRQFCGDLGFRPADDFDCRERISTPERYFWEETDFDGRKEWEEAFKVYQDEISRIILQKAYSGDSFPPEFILHKTKTADTFEYQEVAVFSMSQFIELSRRFSSFSYNIYRVKKGRYKEPVGIEHQAPRFGVIQMQRGGQKQYPTQLQFNLKAGYFYDLDKM